MMMMTGGGGGVSVVVMGSPSERIRMLLVDTVIEKVVERECVVMDGDSGTCEMHS